MEACDSRLPMGCRSWPKVILQEGGEMIRGKEEQEERDQDPISTGSHRPIHQSTNNGSGKFVLVLVLAAAFQPQAVKRATSLISV